MTKIIAFTALALIAAWTGYNSYGLYQPLDWLPYQQSGDTAFAQFVVFVALFGMSLLEAVVYALSLRKAKELPAKMKGPLRIQLTFILVAIIPVLLIPFTIGLSLLALPYFAYPGLLLALIVGIASLIPAKRRPS